VSAVRVRRATSADEAAAWAIVTEYYDAVDVMHRDDPAEFRAYLEGPGALWLAEENGELAGCVAMRPIPSLADDACEVKRLYVRPEHRGKRIAAALMDALEASAGERGYRAIYLDTKDDLVTAIRFYESRGYERIPRYNDNRQATVFMRRHLP
jgi:ribosomal protein S18 acetylase RimI-like enzyme